MTSTSRIPPEAGFVEPSRLPTGPRGFPLCRKCGTETPSKRNTFCSGACVHEWKLRTQPAYQARHVLERDGGVCAACWTDCERVVENLYQLLDIDRRFRGFGRSASPGFVHGFETHSGFFGFACDAMGLPDHLRLLRRRLWEMDHRVPVVEGGGSCGLENLRTLCWACHRRVTRELRKRQAAARRAAKSSLTFDAIGAEFKAAVAAVDAESEEG